MPHLHFAFAPRLGVLAALCCLSLMFPPARAGETPDGGLARVETYLRGLDSLRADFAQYSFNAERTRMIVSRGTFQLQRPGRFRWEYTTPERRVILADGSRVYVHDLELRQISHQSQARALKGTPALLLADDAPIERQFRVRSIDSADGRDWVELIPRDPDSEIARIELGFGAPDRLESLIMEDNFGQGTRLDFTGATRNPRLDPALFQINAQAADDLLSFD